MKSRRNGQGFGNEDKRRITIKIDGIMKKVKRLFRTFKKNLEWSARMMYGMPYGK